MANETRSSEPSFWDELGKPQTNGHGGGTVTKPPPPNQRDRTAKPSAGTRRTGKKAVEAPSDEPPVRVWNALDMDTSRQIEWIAAQRLPENSVCYMLGAEGIGKSLFLVWLTALLTTGKPSPEFGMPARDPQTVVWVITEDDWVMVARPRMELAGVDLAHVRVICADQDGSGAPEFPRDIGRVSEAVADGAALVIVDAWADTLPGGLSVRDPQQARQALHPWKDLATRAGVSVLLSGHTNREKGGNVRNAYGMTGEIRKKARMTMLAQADPDEQGVLTIGPEKSNLAPAVPASRFRIEAVQVFEPTPTSDGMVPRLVWIGDSEHSARDLFTAAAEDEQEDRRDRSEAEMWLEDFLTAAGKPVPSAEVMKAAAERKDGKLSRRTVQRAQERLKLVVSHVGFPRTTMWCLPGDQLKTIDHPRAAG
ncbi:hypothetical protein ATM97_16975 [Nocardia sp. MH4]|uniref:AAA family ATPase n=1 Tax=Nocardia sp. MH4 TaxID=1768677 RepID=UPI001C4E3351|nr:AAA family ATPase [Nocardia sp. MH4]MBW0274302.1 hypothetical protein [Nocardia sp. MH4]